MHPLRNPNGLRGIFVRTESSSADPRTLRWWWWLYAISGANVVLWIAIAYRVHGLRDLYVLRQLALSGVFVAVCAFRSALPRVDLERRCLWNTPLSSIFLGRSLATLAELCFAAQCALLVTKLSALTGSESLRIVGLAIVPLIVVAQIACWYAVLSLNHLGHAIEEVLWAAMVTLLAGSLWTARHSLNGPDQFLGLLGIVACAGTACVMIGIDVPMYVARWRESRSRGVRFLSPIEGLDDAFRRRHVAHSWSDWRPEAPWMSLYFSAGVWLSLGLIFA
jgi:hypothetical protein